MGDLDEFDLNKGHDTLSIRKQYFAIGMPLLLYVLLGASRS